MKNKLISFLNLICCFLSGSIFSSLTIMESSSWRHTLPIFLFCISLRNILKEIDGK